MKFIKLQTVNEKGLPGFYYYANPEKIVGIASLMVPGQIKGPDSKPMAVEQAGLDVGMKIIPINLTPEELVKEIEKHVDLLATTLRKSFEDNNCSI